MIRTLVTVAAATRRVSAAKSLRAGAIALCVLCTALTGMQTPKAEPPASQPATQPAESQPAGTLRTPAQAEILKNLLREREQPRAILPERGASPAGALTPGREPLAPGILPDGTMLMSRPGRFVREGGKPRFILSPDTASDSSRSLEILPNQFLELLERDADAGFAEFTVSADVTLYRGVNYLLIRNLQRRVDHGNLAP